MSHAVTVGNARFSYLGDGLLRCEYAPDGRFDDRPTMRAISMPPPQPFTTAGPQGEAFVLMAPGLEVRYTGTGPLSRETLRVNWTAGGLRGTWSPGDLDYENLVTTFVEIKAARDAQPGLVPGGDAEWRRIGQDVSLWPESLRPYAEEWLKFPPGAVSRSGYTVLDETGLAAYDPATGWIDRAVRPEYQNIFFHCYGRDYALAMRQFIALCGRIALPPRWALGPWYSCFERYSAADNQALVAAFAEHDLPLDVLIVDMDWHVNEWNGWDWNAELYPDVAGFFAWKEQASIKVALNLHCESIGRQDGHFQEICRRLDVPTDVPNPPQPQMLPEQNSWVIDYADQRVWDAVRDVCFVPNEQRGVDFWWLDNWQGLHENYNSCLWINHLVFNHVEEQTGKRPLILGRIAGVGSHRYGAYFSGDTHTHWEVLDCQLEANMRAGQIGMCYFSHDLGGFKTFWPGTPIKLVDPEIYVRWMQMGALSPVMRVHSDHGTREPWKYGERVLEIVRAAYHLHARLVPYFYHLAREAYDTGLPIHRPLYFLYPEDGAALTVRDQYFLGDRLLVAPVAQPGGRRRVYLPAGEFFALPDGALHRGPQIIDRVFHLDEIPLYARAGSLIPMQDVTPRIGTRLPDPLVLAVYPGGDDELALYEDDGDSPAYRDGACSRWPLALRDDGHTVTVSLRPMEGSFAGMPTQRRVRIELFFIDKPVDVRATGLAGGTAASAVAWSYDEARRCVVITLPALDVRGSYTVAVART